jgi:hypothetical protein
MVQCQVLFSVLLKRTKKEPHTGHMVWYESK